MRQPSEMRPYQNNIATFLYERDEALCVARPGGGKTVAALTAIKDLTEQAVIHHALVLAPKRVARVVWPDEIANWEHVEHLYYQVLTGSPARREDMLKASSNYDLTICGLDITQWLMETLDKYPDDHPIFDLLIVDEISRLRNPRGKRAKELAKRAHRFKMIWGLTGTLRPNGAEDLFMPARVVSRDQLWGRSFDRWRQQHFVPLDWNGYRWGPLPGAEDKLNAELAPYIVTLGDNDMPELPKLSVILDKVTLPPAARHQYDDMESKLFARGGKDGVITAASAGVATGKLAQAANGFMYDNNKLPVALHDEKREWLADLLEDASGPTLVVYEFIEDLQMLLEVAGGMTPFLGAGATDKDADQAIKDWNAGKLKVMGLHPASGGHGLNLQHGGADMAWISPCWSPEFWEQTIARIHRSGQTRPVMVRVCVARDTVDEMKLARVYEKMTAQQAFEAYLRRFQARAA